MYQGKVLFSCYGHILHATCYAIFFFRISNFPVDLYAIWGEDCILITLKYVIKLTSTRWLDIYFKYFWKRKHFLSFYSHCVLELFEIRLVKTEA